MSDAPSTTRPDEAVTLYDVHEVADDGYVYDTEYTTTRDRLLQVAELLEWGEEYFGPFGERWIKNQIAQDRDGHDLDEISMHNQAYAHGVCSLGVLQLGVFRESARFVTDDIDLALWFLAKAERPEDDDLMPIDRITVETAEEVVINVNDAGTTRFEWLRERFRQAAATARLRAGDIK